MLPPRSLSISLEIWAPGWKWCVSPKYEVSGEAVPHVLLSSGEAGDFSGISQIPPRHDCGQLLSVFLGSSIIGTPVWVGSSLSSFCFAACQVGGPGCLGIERDKQKPWEVTAQSLSTPDPAQSQAVFQPSCPSQQSSESPFRSQYQIALFGKNNAFLGFGVTQARVWIGMKALNLSLPQFLFLQTRDKNTHLIKLLGGSSVITEPLCLSLPLQHFSVGKMITKLIISYLPIETNELTCLATGQVFSIIHWRMKLNISCHISRSGIKDTHFCVYLCEELDSAILKAQALKLDQPDFVIY